MGVGAGQMNRVNSARIAVDAGGRERASAPCARVDAFMPFPDSLEVVRRRRRDRGHPAGRLGARRGVHRQGRRAGRGDGLHRAPPLPPLGGPHGHRLRLGWLSRARQAPRRPAGQRCARTPSSPRVSAVRSRSSTPRASPCRPRATSTRTPVRSSGRAPSRSSSIRPTPPSSRSQPRRSHSASSRRSTRCSPKAMSRSTTSRSSPRRPRSQILELSAELAEGSAHFDERRPHEAAWEWTFQFDEWGTSALAAVSALHELLWGAR